MRKQTRLAAALAIRDAAVCIVHRQGVIKEYEGRKGHAPKKYVGATFGPFKISYRTPFQPQPAIRERDKYIAAQHSIKLPAILPYALDVWRGTKVLSIEWDAYGAARLIGYRRRGEWEAELLAAAHAAQVF
jgi:hypothetical protein